MNSIPIFDSLTHPMPNGDWLSPEYKGQNTAKNLLYEMNENNIKWALAVGMGPKIGGYSEDEYASFVRNCSENLFPVAFVDFQVLESGLPVGDYLKILKKLGYIGIKIHPRISNINLSNTLLPEVIKAANKVEMAVLLCTYLWSSDKNQMTNTLDKLFAMLYEVPEQKIILLHGGAIKLLEVAEMVRNFKGLLLDLSFTLCKYEGSSIDLDIRYVFEKLDKRVCVGSDSPEFKLSQLRKRFDTLTEGLDIEKKKNIGYRNLQKYLGVDLCK